MNKNKKTIPVRFSHLLRHCSVGSILRGPEFLMTVKDIRSWTDKNGNIAAEKLLFVDRVRSALGIEAELRKPPIATELENGEIDGVCVPAIRFPSWTRCRKCGLLYYKPWKNQRHERTFTCKCGAKLDQVPWVIVHPDGYMADVPWHYLAHKDANNPNQKQCARDIQDSYLKLTKNEISNHKLYCTRCRITAIFSDSILIPYGTMPCQPWLKDGADSSDELAHVLAVNDTRVHSPTLSNALVIPPESRFSKDDVLSQLYQSSSLLEKIQSARTPLAYKGCLNELARDFKCTTNDIETALKEIEKGYPYYGQTFTPGLLLEDEYKAILKESDFKEREDFVTRHLTHDWKKMVNRHPIGEQTRNIIKAVSHLVSIVRLKEIQVLKGFRRLGGKLVSPDIMNESGWLPAIELYGEGIFFALNEDILVKWESQPELQKLLEVFKMRYVNAPSKYFPEPLISPRFLLLHTLSHLIIRQLESQAGYPAASLKERIYSSPCKTKMSGILIYVAVPDIAGSLGGVAELAKPEQFLSLLSDVFNHAEWCSLDPVCSEHEGQGPSLLNRAACHACALIPEPSCAYGNTLLDRTFIRGDIKSGILGFLNYINDNEDIE